MIGRYDFVTPTRVQIACQIASIRQDRRPRVWCERERDSRKTNRSTELARIGAQDPMLLVASQILAASPTVRPERRGGIQVGQAFLPVPIGRRRCLQQTAIPAVARRLANSGGDHAKV